jgi:hypothetical protein
MHPMLELSEFAVELASGGNPGHDPHTGGRSER